MNELRILTTLPVDATTRLQQSVSDNPAMQVTLCFLLIFASGYGIAQTQQDTPQQSLNHYVSFLNQSVDVLTSRFQMLQAYQAEAAQYRKKPDFLLNLASSGPLEEVYYQKAIAGSGLTPAEKQRLTASTKALWQLLGKIDETGKSLETYVRLKDYQRDNLNQSDALIREIQALFGQFSRDKDALFNQIERIYRRYQPYLASNAYLYTEKEMELALREQYQLLDTLTYYLNEDSRSDWPVALVQQSMLADEKRLAAFGTGKSAIDYPASDMVSMFRTALQSIQAVKRRAIDDNTFAARQSVRHGNAVYLSLLNHVNNGLLASHQAFVNYSRTARQLLSYVKFSPVFRGEPAPSAAPTVAQTAHFADKPLIAFKTKPAAVPASRATFTALNGYVAFINESLRQMHQFQVALRNYESSAEYYRDPGQSGRRANLTYSHENVKLPVSEYQLLINSSQSIPPAYRTAINTQAEVLMNMLKEMDELSIELIAYTTQKQYVQDRLSYSDAILDRYAYLFDAFDQKKEQLYRDVRRIYESYPVADPGSAWNLAGKAMQKTLDYNTDVLFGLKAFLRLEAATLPATDKLEADGRTLIADEYKNLKGLQRLGPSNGLCPYSPYEGLAENTLRFAGMAQKIKPVLTSTTTHPYESVYYFYNNELVYPYNKFTELAKVNLLMAVNQPNVFLLHRAGASPSFPVPPRNTEEPGTRLAVSTKPVTTVPKPQTNAPKATAAVPEEKTNQRDTVYVERTKTDTVYVDRGIQREVPNTLTGFATNNMVLLLDVSASMDAPVKLPLLKRSIKSLLTLLRPEDQIASSSIRARQRWR